MNDRDALLRAIAAHPDEDTPRLVYADYLDEAGGASSVARAEFIRLHVRAARLAPDDPEREPVVRGIDRLLCKWDFAWQKDMPTGFRTLSGYRRGFAHRAAAVASEVSGGDDPRTLLVEHLELTADASASRLRKTVKAPLFTRLRALVVRGDPIGWRSARALAGGEYPRLERLVLARLRIGDSGLRALAESGGFPSVRALDVSDNGITSRGLSAFRESRFYARLERVDDHGNGAQ